MLSLSVCLLSFVEVKQVQPLPLLEMEEDGHSWQITQPKAPTSVQAAKNDESSQYSCTK